MLNTIVEVWNTLKGFDGKVTYDVSMRRWGQALPCLFFHELGNPCNQLTGFVNISEAQAALLCERHNTKQSLPAVTICLEDWGDEDRRLMMLNLYAGNLSLGLFDSFAEVKAFCEEHGYIIRPDVTTTPRVNTSNKITTP